ATQRLTDDGQNIVTIARVSEGTGLDVAIGRWHQRDDAHHGRVALSTHFRDPGEGLADAYLSALHQGLERFEGWLDAYPHPTFAVVEMPFDGVFAFRGFTLIGTHQLTLEETLAVTLQHELLHGWFGHHVYLGPGGNWVEGLVTYLVEHEVVATRHRVEAVLLRKQLLQQHVERHSGPADLPMRLVSHSCQHASASLGYAKGAMIFHMLRRRVGDAAFFEALRLFVGRYGGEAADWEELLLKFEEASGERLAEF